MLRDGMKAVTIRVNDVEGVGGFVLPGDRVDVVLTRQIDKGNGHAPRSCCRTSRVLAIDQIADERTDKPAVVKAVTLEVDIGRRAEALARGLGRHAVADAAQGRRGQQPIRRARITLSDLGAPATPTATPERPVRDHHGARRRGEDTRGIQRAGRRRRGIATAAGRRSGSLGRRTGFGEAEQWVGRVK